MRAVKRSSCHTIAKPSVVARWDPYGAEALRREPASLEAAETVGELEHPSPPQMTSRAASTRCFVDLG
jgi:hypothetical protein